MQCNSSAELCHTATSSETRRKLNKLWGEVGVGNRILRMAWHACGWAYVCVRMGCAGVCVQACMSARGVCRTKALLLHMDPHGTRARVFASMSACVCVCEHACMRARGVHRTRALLLHMEPQVLQEDDGARGGVGARLLHLLTHAVRQEVHGATQLLLSTTADRVGRGGV